MMRHEPLPPTMSFDDSTPGEIHAELGAFTINYAGKTIMPVKTRGSLTYIQWKYVWPIIQEFQGAELYQRKTPSGSEYFAIKAGLMVVGIVMPYAGLINDRFVESLEHVARDAREKLDAKKAAEEMPGQFEVMEEPRDEANL